MDFIGHENTKNRMKIAVASAKQRNTSIPHILLSGTAGCGKTTVAKWLTKLGNYTYLPASPSELKTKRAVYSLLEKLNIEGYNDRGDRIGIIKPTILFFDEIHQLPVIGQEILGLAMERFILDANIPNKVIWLPYFTIVGATTNDGILTKPFRDRFNMKFIFKPYSDTDMQRIIKFHALRNKLMITNNAVINIAKRSRGIPRIMINYLNTIRDLMLAKNLSIVHNTLVNLAFEMLGVDDTGLTNVEIKLLKTLFNAKAAIGLDNLSIMVNESNKTISQTIEPFLIRRGLIIRTGKGRLITEKGIKYLEDRGHLHDDTINSKKCIDISYQRG